MRYILYAILIYIAYQFIFSLVIPVYRTSRKIKKGFQEMNSRMQEQANKQQTNPGASSAKPWDQPSTKKKEAGDYIDFEELK